MSKTKSTLFRTLAVFMAVVILCFAVIVQPAQAAVITVGTGLLLFIAAILVACGMVFTSETQALSAAQSAWNNMGGMHQTLLNEVYERLDRVLSYEHFQKGFPEYIEMSAVGFGIIKSWVQSFGTLPDYWQEYGSCSELRDDECDTGGPLVEEEIFFPRLTGRQLAMGSC